MEGSYLLCTSTTAWRNILNWHLDPTLKSDKTHLKMLEELFRQKTIRNDCPSAVLEREKEKEPSFTHCLPVTSQDVFTVKSNEPVLEMLFKCDLDVPYPNFILRAMCSKVIRFKSFLFWHSSEAVQERLPQINWI